MKVERNVSLKPYNTFGIDVAASHFTRIQGLDDLREALTAPGLPEPFILSGGSNILLTGPLNRLVLYLDTRGKEILDRDADQVLLRVMAGENWHELVMWCLEQGFGGIENLALIPGKTGTAPIQNIGAYGVEIKEVLAGLEAIELKTGQLKRFTREECELGYRDSIFKGRDKGRYLIWSVDLRLSCRNHHIRTEYGAISGQLEAEGIDNPSPAQVAQAVIRIRQSKLPDPEVLGNSGSFFKNPVIPAAHYAKLTESYPDIPGYAQGEWGVKVPAGWLIEHLGFKGTRRGDAGVHEKQALVLVNHGAASGADILDLAREIQTAVADTFEIHIEPEVNIL